MATVMYTKMEALPIALIDQRHREREREIDKKKKKKKKKKFFRSVFG